MKANPVHSLTDDELIEVEALLLGEAIPAISMDMLGLHPEVDRPGRDDVAVVVVAVALVGRHWLTLRLDGNDRSGAEAVADGSVSVYGTLRGAEAKAASLRREWEARWLI